MIRRAWTTSSATRRSSRACDEKVVRFDGYQMLSLGYSNSTPWNSPRELEEDALYERIVGLAEQIDDQTRAVWNIHVPPRDSQLDTAAELDEDFNIVLVGRQPHLIPVGSSAVRGRDRALPAAGRAPRPHPRVAGRDPHRPHAVHQPGQRLPHRTDRRLPGQPARRPRQPPVRHGLMSRDGARSAGCEPRASSHRRGRGRSPRTASRTAAAIGSRSRASRGRRCCAPCSRRRPPAGCASTAFPRAPGSCCCPTRSSTSWRARSRARRRGVPVPRSARGLGRGRPGARQRGRGRRGARRRGRRGVRGRGPARLRPRDPQRARGGRRRARRAGAAARARCCCPPS